MKIMICIIAAGVLLCNALIWTFMRRCTCNQPEEGKRASPKGSGTEQITDREARWRDEWKKCD